MRVSFSELTGRAFSKIARLVPKTIRAGEGAGLQLSLPQNSDYVAGTSELPVQTQLATHLKSGDVFYDIGANVGFFSLIAARIVGPSGRVYALEPVPENARQVRRNAALNSFSHLSVFETAVGHTDTVADLLVTDWDGGGTLSSSPVAPNKVLGKRQVQVVRLDNFVRAMELRPPSMIKIDVEGVELEVLEGASETIHKYRPVLVYEVDDGDIGKFNERRTHVDSVVSSFGYTIVHLNNSYPDIAWNVGHSVAIPS